MSTQPEALSLADALDDEFTQGRISNHNGRKAAIKLRRLHDANQELLEALKVAACEIADWGSYASEYFQNKHDLQGAISRAEAAIAKATGEQA